MAKSQRESQPEMIAVALRQEAAGWLADAGSRAYWIRAVNLFLGGSCGPADVKGLLETFFYERTEILVQSYQPKLGDFKGFVFAALRNYCRTEFWRITGRRPTDRFDYFGDSDSIPTNHAHPDQAEYLSAARDQETLQHALAEIPDIHRAAFTLVTLQGVPIDEAASSLQIRPEYARVCHYRAVQGLTRLLSWSRPGISLLDLTDISHLCQSLQEAGLNDGSTVGRRVWDLLPLPYRGLVAQVASGYRPTTVETGNLLRALNSVLERLDFFISGNIDVPESARNHPDVRSLLKRPQRGPIASFRLNRLLFDAFFRDSMRSQQ